MNILAKTTNKKSLFTLDLIVGIVIMAAAVIAIPIAIFSIDPSLVEIPAIWILVIALVLFFGSVGFFGYLRPFLIFRKMPKVQAETDGEYLYLHGKKEAKLPLAALAKAKIHEEIPYLISWSFIVHLASEQFGNVVIKVPKHGKFKLYYVARARQVAIELITMSEEMARK